MKEIITGRNPVYEVLKSHRRHCFKLQIAKGVEQKGRLVEIIKMVRGFRLPIEMVERRQLDSLSEGHQGVALEVSSYPYSSLQEITKLAKKRDEPLFVLLLDVIQNPQNLGALLRTAEVVGVHGVVMPTRRAAGVTPAVVHASAGASEHMLVTQANIAQAIATLKEENAWVIGLEGSQSSQPISQVRLDGALAIVVGSEGKGMRKLVRQSCDILARLPMRGQIESLNAAVAGSVTLYLALMQRQQKGQS